MLPPHPTVAVRVRLVDELSHLAPTLAAAARRLRLAKETRATIEEIYDGPRALGWHYKVPRTQSATLSLTRTGWHAIGLPVPRAVSAAILAELRAATAEYDAAAMPVLTAARAAGLADTISHHDEQCAHNVLWALERDAQEPAPA